MRFWSIQLFSAIGVPGDARISSRDARRIDQHVAPPGLQIQALHEDAAVPADTKTDFKMRMIVVKYRLSHYP